MVTVKGTLRWNSLSVRLMASFCVYVLVVTVLFTVGPYLFVKRSIDETLREEGVGILENIRPGIANVAAAGADPLRRYLRGLPAAERFIAYVLVADEEGKIVASSDDAFAGRPWDGLAATRAKTGGEGYRSVPYRDGTVVEISAPILFRGKPAGHAVLGMNSRSLQPILDRLLLVLWVIGGSVCLGSLLSCRPFTAKIVSGIDRLVVKTRDVASGELKSHVPEEGFDEIRALAQAFNAMAENLRSIIREIQDTGAVVGEFSASVSQAIQEQASGAAAEAASVAEVTATAEELTRTSRQIADNAESVKNTAAQSVEMAQQGNVLLREAVGSMETIRDRVGDIAQKILFLREKSNEIGKVMEIIKEIASEIHLLALNAAIESAAAGEHGRRFSVVASEVRRLADKTRESTETIRAIISEIQSATNSSVRATEDGTREVDKGRETVKLSSSAFEEIIQMIEKTSESSTQISMATHQQTSANEQVVQVMRQVAESVRHSAGQMKESAASVGELKELATRLREKASLFRV